MHRTITTATVLLALALPVSASAQFFTVDQATGTTGGEIGFTYITFQDIDDVSARLLRGFVEYATAQSGDRWSGYLSFASSAANSSDPGFGPDSVDGVLGIEVGATYSSDLSPTSGVTLRAGMTLPRDGDREEFGVAGLVLPARLTDFVLLLPETLALRLAASAHGKTGSLVYRVDGGLDVPLGGDLGEDLDTLLRVNGALGVAAGPTVIGVELANLINIEESGDDAMLHTLSAGVRANFGGIQPGVALTFPLDDDFSDFYSTVLQLSLRASLP